MTAKGWNNFFFIEEMDVEKMWHGEGEPEVIEEPIIPEPVNNTIYLTLSHAENGCIKQKVYAGYTYTYQFAPNDGWKVHSVTFNEEDVSSQLDAEYRFTTPVITNNSMLSVIYEKDNNNAINSVLEEDSSVKILCTSYGIKVTGTNTDDLVQVYSANGTLQKTVKAKSLQTNIDLDKGCVYIVKVGTKTMKLSL